MVETLAVDQDLAETVVDEEWRVLHSHCGLTLEDVRGPALANFRYLLELLSTSQTPASDHDVSIWQETGRTRARQGVRIENLTDAAMASAQAVRARARELLDTSPRREALLYQLLDLTLAWTRVALRHTADGYRHVEQQLVEEEEQRRTSFVRGVLTGGNSPSALETGIVSYELDLDWPYHGLRAHPTDAVGLRDIERWLQSGAADGRGSMVALVDGDVCGFTSVLPDASSVGIPVGTCGPMPLGDLHRVYPTASRALAAATAFGLRGCHSFPELTLHAAVVADDDVGAALVERYIAPVQRIGRAGASLLQTVDCYLQNGSRLDVTAQAMHVHTNTIRYRLTRFEKLTGCSLRTTEVMVGVWWALERRRLTRTLGPAGGGGSTLTVGG
jgi:hypothetical protein